MRSARRYVSWSPAVTTSGGSARTRSWRAEGPFVMCGVAGVFHYSDLIGTPSHDALFRMTRRLSHRGPDDEQIHVDGAIGLGHRRLSIIDLTSSGRQPMRTVDDAFALSY